MSAARLSAAEHMAEQRYISFAKLMKVACPGLGYCTLYLDIRSSRVSRCGRRQVAAKTA